MPELDQNAAEAFIRDLDLMARAAYTWVRQQTFEQRFIGLPVGAVQEAELAAGFLAGLTARMELDESELIQLAYVYMLMTGQRSGAFKAARHLIDRELGAFDSCSSYLHGLKAARDMFFECTDEMATGASARIQFSRSVN
jgi:hypothetical protein